MTWLQHIHSYLLECTSCTLMLILLNGELSRFGQRDTSIPNNPMIPPRFNINTSIRLDRNNTWMVSDEDPGTKSTYISYMFCPGLHMEYSPYTLILTGPVTLILVIFLCILWHSFTVYCSWLWSTHYLYRSAIYIWRLYLYIFRYRQNCWGGRDTLL